MDERDELTKQIFNQNRINLVLGEGVDAESLDDSASIARLVGAPDDSIVHVDEDDEQMIFRVENPIYFSDHPVWAAFNEAGRGGALRLHAHQLNLRPELKGRGIGPRCVIVSIYEAKKQGFSHVSLSAFGGLDGDGFGYYVWPCLGFDAEIPEATRANLPLSLQTRMRLSDLLRDLEGRNWWRERGRTIEAEFDLADNSASWKLLSMYMMRKGIHL